MHKILPVIAALIIVLSLVALVYCETHPIINTCGSLGTGGIVPAVCIYQKTPNWPGINTSVAALTVGVFLAIYSFVARNKKK